jgi:hypothetical protein
VMTALSPGRAEVGGSTRTTVASTQGVPFAVYSRSSSSTSSAIP